MSTIIETLRSLLPLLPARSRRFMVIYVVVTCALSVLDVAVLLLIAGTFAPMMNDQPLSIPGIGEVGNGAVVWLLGGVSLLVVLKGILAVWMQRIATRRFASYELVIGDQLFDAYIRSPWVERLKRSTAQLVRLADVGIGNVTGGFLLPIIGLPAQATTFLTVLITVTVLDPLTAGVTLLYLGAVGAGLYFGVSRRAMRAGTINRDVSFQVASLMTEMMGALKEITLRDKAPEVAGVVHSRRVRSTSARASIAFLGAVPRYVLESALILGFMVVGGVAYLAGGADTAMVSIAYFAIAGFRMIPSITTFQTIMTATTANVPHVRAVIEDIYAAQKYVAEAENLGSDPLPATPRTLTLRDVSFTYPGAKTPAVHQVDLAIPMGSKVALVGSSGAGKSTLVDILLGLLPPSGGDIDIDGQKLTDVLRDWRSRVGYVPQDVALFDATIAQNVALTWGDEIDRERVRAALARAQLLDVVEDRPGGLDARIGDRGLALSGGQRQRLGIARALYVEPLILVLDEATSALDTTTESLVSAAISELRGEVTVIAVAHRLSTIRDADQVCFMEDGRIAAVGTFDELVRDVPEFATQAAYAGLADQPGAPAGRFVPGAHPGESDHPAGLNHHELPEYLPADQLPSAARHAAPPSFPPAMPRPLFPPRTGSAPGPVDQQ